MLKRTAHAKENIGKAILCSLGASLIFTLLNGVVKHLSPLYPASEMAFFRFIFAIPLVVLLAHFFGGVAQLKTARLSGHLLRGTAGSASAFLLFTAFALLPLAKATTLTFAGPLFITLLSMPLLGEKISKTRWLAVSAGFIGVIIASTPWHFSWAQDVSAGFSSGFSAGLSWGVMAAIGSAFFYGLAHTTIRKLANTESPLCTTFWFFVVGGLVMSLSLPFVWVTPQGMDWLWLLALGILGGLGQWLVTTSYHYADASLVSPYIYVAIIWSALMGYIGWQEVPSLSLLVGAAIIIGSSLLYTRYEWRQRHK